MSNSIPKLWLSEIVGRGINAIALVVTVRLIGVEAYGMVGYVASIVVCLLAVVQFGSDFIAVRELASASKYSAAEKAEWRTSVLFFRIMLALCAASALILLGCLESEAMLKKLFFASIAGVFGMIVPLDALFQLELQFGKIAAARVLISLLNFAGILLFVSSSPAAWCIPLISGVSMMLTQGLFIARMNIDMRVPNVRLALRRFGFLLREGLPLCASIILSLLLGQAAIMFLRWFRTPQERGQYTASFRVFDIANALLVPAATVLYPHIAALRPQGDRGERTHLINNGVRISVSLAIGLLGVALLGAAPILPLVFGSQFQSSGVFLEILAVALFFRSISMFFANTLIAVGRQPLNFFIAVAVTLVNLGLGYAAIPHFGPLGAAVTTVCAFAGEFVLLSIAIRNDVFYSVIVASVRKILMMGAGAFAASWAVGYCGATLSHNAVAGAVIAIIVFSFFFIRWILKSGTVSMESLRGSPATVS